MHNKSIKERYAFIADGNLTFSRVGENGVFATIAIAGIPTDGDLSADLPRDRVGKRYVCSTQLSQKFIDGSTAQDLVRLLRDYWRRSLHDDLTQPKGRKAMSETKKYKCIHCRELMAVDAQRCPHCHKPSLILWAAVRILAVIGFIVFWCAI